MRRLITICALGSVALTGCSTFNGVVEKAGLSDFAVFAPKAEPVEDTYTLRGKYIAEDLSANLDGSVEPYSHLSIITGKSTEYGHLEDKLRGEGYAVSLRGKMKYLDEEQVPVVFSVQNIEGEENLAHGVLCIGDHTRIGRIYSVSDNMVLNYSPISRQMGDVHEQSN